MGDNSEDQCAISGRRANEPEVILKDFLATDIFAGDSQNVAVSSDSELYSWGGTTFRTAAWASQNANESKLGIMEDLKRRKVSLITAAYSSIVVITGQTNIVLQSEV